MNTKIILLVVGLVIGGAIGYVERPESAEINVGPLHVEVQGDQPAQGNGPLTSSQMRYIAIFAVIGGVLGLAIGFAVDRRKRA